MKIKKEAVFDVGSNKDNIIVPASGKTVQDVLRQVESQFGKGSIRILGDSKIEEVPVISTGSLLIDGALVIGGFPRGRIIECYGAEGGGKTSLSLKTIANAQKEGGQAAFIDAEHALDLNMAKNMGVDVTTLAVSQPDSAEQALEIMDMLVSSGLFSIVVLDSVAALVPQAELDGEMGDQQVGLQARLMGKALRKLAGKISKTNTCVIFINQLRSKIGQFFGDPDTTSGGRALKFSASIRLDIRRIGAIKRGSKEDAEIIGNRVKVKVVKNKLAPPYRTIETDFIFGKGFDKCGELFDIALDNKIIDKSGSWYSYNNERIGQGREASVDFIRDHTEIYNALLADVQISGGRHANKEGVLSNAVEEV